MEKKQTKAKKIGGIVVNVILWLFVVFAVIITVIAFSASSNAKNVPTIGGKCYLNVQSDSMNGEKPEWVPENKYSGFKKGDLIIGKYIAESDEAIDALEIGDIVTYEWDINGDGQISTGEYNTHRISNIYYDDGGHVVSLFTIGDNRNMSLVTEQVQRSGLIAVYTGKKSSGIGSMLNFLSSQLGFGLCILLPLVLFFGYELFVFIKTVIKVKNEGKKVITSADEEIIKQKAIEEYLRQQSEGKGNSDSETPETKEDGSDGK